MIKNKTHISTGFIFFMISMFTVSAAFAQVKLENAFPNLNFIRPVDFQIPGDNSNRIFVVEQQGRIYVFENDPNETQKNLFLDIRDRVNDGGNEEGLLGLAFHPDYENNGYFYVDYTAANPRRTVISRFSVSTANPDQADSESEFILMQVDQPFSNHNAGQIVFGPDNNLYITFGDGGAGGDPRGNGQNRATLLATIARIDVDAQDDGLNYSIPADNPFVGNSDGYREEIYAYGLRNPWRISFDFETGQLWAADVGQNQYEEVNIIEKGKNYGWKIMEGFHCYNTATCDTTGLVLPVVEYDHGVGQSITGGFVYRGATIPELVGKYVYADYVSGRIWTLDYEKGVKSNDELLLNTSHNIAAFGEDQNKELYICVFDGNIYKFVPTSTKTGKRQQLNPTSFALGQNYPNPFNASTVIPYHLSEKADVKLEIYSMTGDLVHHRNVKQHAGSHRFTWNLKHQTTLIASGVYLYTLSVNNDQAYRKMIVLN